MASLRPLADSYLYSFVDMAYVGGRDPAEIVRQLCEGGADLVQLRAKGWERERVRRLAERLGPIVAGFGAWFVVNDDAALAWEVGAPMCHLGQEDFFDGGFRNVAEVGARVGSRGVGLSSHAPEQAERAIQAGAEYVAVGPVFATATKPGRPAVTLDYVRWAAATLTLPWFAIGGIDFRTLDSVLAAGARRVAVVSAILNAPDVAQACREFRRRLVGN